MDLTKSASFQSTRMENSANSKGIHILLVDDTYDLARITARLLELHGYKVSIRYNGAECIEAAELLQPDLILTDIDMPLMDGISACEQIRRQPWGNKIAIVALSGNVQRLLDDPSSGTCFDARLRKSARFEELIMLIQMTVDLRRRRL
jgi:CheY-like chemotaxis protein